MSPRNSLSQLFTDIFNSLKKRGEPSLQKEEFISLFEDTEDMINDLREQYKMFITSTEKSDLLLMTEDIMTVDDVIQRAESLLTAVFRELKDPENDIIIRKAYLRKQIELIRQATACGYFAVSALCESGNNPKDKGILKKLQKKGLLRKTDIDEIAKTDVCSLEQRHKIIYQNTNTSDTYRGKRSRVTKKPSNSQNNSSFREFFNTFFRRIVAFFVN